MATEITAVSPDAMTAWADVPFNEALIHQAVVAYEANQRADTAATKSRTKRSGKNKKPWRQKGTGRARHGSEISPLWVGGGRAHGPTGEQDHSKGLTHKMKRTALLSALGQRAREENIYLLEGIDLDEPSTSTMDTLFEENQLNEKQILLGLLPDRELLFLSTRNLPYCKPYNVKKLSVYQVVANNCLVFVPVALENLKERLNNGV